MQLRSHTSGCGVVRLNDDHTGADVGPCAPRDAAAGVSRRTTGTSSRSIDYFFEHRIDPSSRLMLAVHPWATGEESRNRWEGRFCGDFERAAWHARKCELAESQVVVDGGTDRSAGAIFAVQTTLLHAGAGSPFNQGKSLAPAPSAEAAAMARPSSLLASRAGLSPSPA